jgi:hypothetical protein
MTDDTTRRHEQPGRRSLREYETEVLETTAATAAGAIAGAAAGLSTLVFGPFGAIVGAIVGGLAGGLEGAVGARALDDNLYTPEYDAYYHALWEGTPDRAADRTFDAVRPAFQFGHIAAQHREYLGRDFDLVEPGLRQHWSEELRAHAGEWDAVQRHVESGYSYARSRGLAERRDPTVVGSAGSAVDPVELARARAR